MLYQRGDHNGSNMGSRMHSYPLSGPPEARRPFAEVLAAASCRRPGASTAGPSASRPNWSPGTSSPCSESRGHRAGLQLEGRRSHYRGIPSWCSLRLLVSRFSSDPGVVGKKILVNDFPMTIVASRRAALRDQIRRSRPRSAAGAHEARQLPDWSGSTWTIGVPMGAGVRAAETRLHGESAKAPCRDCSRGPTYEMTLSAAKTWSQYSRAQFMRGRCSSKARRWLLGASQRLLDGDRRAEVHGRTGPADRVRQRGEL